MQFGNTDLYVLNDGDCMSDGGGVYGLVPRSLWEKVTPPDEENRVPTVLNSLLIVSQNKKILVDTGLGAKLDARGEAHFGRRGGSTLLSQLRERGLAPEDIDIVINTHLHADHCGGNRRFADDFIHLPDIHRFYLFSGLGSGFFQRRCDFRRQALGITQIHISHNLIGNRRADFNPDPGLFLQKFHRRQIRDNKVNQTHQMLDGPRQLDIGRTHAVQGKMSGDGVSPFQVGSSAQADGGRTLADLPLRGTDGSERDRIEACVIDVVVPDDGNVFRDSDLQLLQGAHHRQRPA